MDPVALTGYEWSDIGRTLTNIWLMVGFVVVAAANILIGHIFVPSLVSSRHLPAFVGKIRPMFYGVALLAFAVAFYELVAGFELVDVIKRFWHEPWI